MNCHGVVINSPTFYTINKPSPLNLVWMTLSWPPPTDGEIWIWKSVEATFNYTGSKGWNWAGMKCFLCIDFFFFFSASVDVLERGGDNCNLPYRCTAGKQGVAPCMAFFSCFLFNTMRACISNHPSHLIRKCHWIEKEVGQVWKEATQALYLDRVLMVFVICFDIWQTLANLWCGFL